MAVRKFFLAIGQSNADATALISSWLTSHPELDLRNASDFTFGSYDDNFSLPGGSACWPATVASQTINLRGKAVRNIRFLTMYNPQSTGYFGYPGTGRIMSVDGTNPTTDIITQQTYTGNPSGLTITRKRTGVVHTITAHSSVVVGGITYGKITVSPAFSPAPSIGEDFTYELSTPILVPGPGTTITTQINWGAALGAGGATVASLVGLELEYLGPAHNGQVGDRKKITGVSGNSITIESAFTQNPHAGDKFRIVAPKNGANLVPIHEYGYFLPWSQFEGSVTEATYQPSPKTNPFPAGFNYPQQYSAPGFFWNPFNGTAWLQSTQARMSFVVGLAAKLHQSIGEDIYCVPLAVGGASLALREQSVVNTFGYGWLDPQTNNNWNPSDPTSLYARLMDTLDAAIVAAARQGDTLQCVGVFVVQGEQDAGSESTANSYYDNLKKFKSTLRADILAKGLWSGDSSKIPWVQSFIVNLFSGSEKINDSILKCAMEDRYMATFDVQDVELQDAVHFSGAGLTKIEQRMFESWRKINNPGITDVDICNLALSHIGDTAIITGISPPDGSVQASHCAKFYPIARDGLLQMHSWLFATKRKALVETTNTISQWRYAYLMPSDVGDSFAIIASDSSSDYTETYSVEPYYSGVNIDSTVGRYSPQQFAVEVNNSGQRVIYTNQENAVIRYTAMVTDTSQFSPLFVTALSWHLASMLAGPIIKGENGSAEAKRCQQMMMLYLSKAQSSDSNQRNVKPSHIVNWISGR